MCKRNERTLKMIDEYYGLFLSGMSPIEIADKFHVSFSIMYKCLGEIAARHGVTRDSLLIQPHNYPTTRQNRAAARTTTKPSDILMHFEDVKRRIVSGRKEIEENIKNMTEYLEEVQ